MLNQIVAYLRATMVTEAFVKTRLACCQKLFEPGPLQTHQVPMDMNLDHTSLRKVERGREPVPVLGRSRTITRPRPVSITYHHPAPLIALMNLTFFSSLLYSYVED